MVNSNISNKIKYLYFILTIGMVMYHSRWIDVYNTSFLNKFDKFGIDMYVNIADHIGFVCMVFFFFMSAFWFYYKLDNNKDTLKKWKKKIKTLLIPFLVWSVILGCYRLVTNQITISFDNIFYHLFETPVAGPLWYILGLLILQLFAPIVVFLKKRKMLVTGLFSIIIVYISLRSLGIVPNLLSFENWWWYNNLIFYTPVYILGAYIGMYYPELLLNKEYNTRKYTLVGIILVVLVFIFWHFIISSKHFLYIIYSLIYLIGIWFILKPKFCKKKIPEFLNCGFYIYALHNPVLIPITSKIIELLLNGGMVCGIEIILIKIIQLCSIVLISAIAKKVASRVFSSEFNYYLTGGR